MQSTHAPLERVGVPFREQRLRPPVAACFIKPVRTTSKVIHAKHNTIKARGTAYEAKVARRFSDSFASGWSSSLLSISTTSCGGQMGSSSTSDWNRSGRSPAAAAAAAPPMLWPTHTGRSTREVYSRNTHGNLRVRVAYVFSSQVPWVWQ